MKFGSVCSGIEAASVAFNPLGWTASWFSEIDDFPSAVLRYHYPDTPNLGDMTAITEKIRTGAVEAPDILCGGTPCQAFSVAGERKSLSDDRGNLTLIFTEIADAIDIVRSNDGRQPAIIFWENVPGVLSTKDNAFGCFLGKLSGSDFPLTTPSGRWSHAGYVVGKKRKIAWRILDAQHFGVAQRRRRVFLVATAREDIDPSKILFEREGLHRDIKQIGKEGKADTRTSENSTPYNCDEIQKTIIDFSHPCDVYRLSKNVPTLLANMGIGGNRIPCIIHDTKVYEHHSSDARLKNVSVCPTLTTQMDNLTDLPIVLKQTIGLDRAFYSQGTNAKFGFQAFDDRQPALTARGLGAVCERLSIRRLTPIECERLQGFPDDYTKIPWRNKPADLCPDSRRYKALGNSWAVPCVQWIAKRIKAELEGKL